MLQYRRRREKFIGEPVPVPFGQIKAHTLLFVKRIAMAVIDNRGRHIEAFPSVEKSAQAKVGFLMIGEIPGVEYPYVINAFPAVYRRCPVGDEDEAVVMIFHQAVIRFLRADVVRREVGGNSPKQGIDEFPVPIIHLTAADDPYFVIRFE